MAVHPSMETERTRASGKLYTWEASKWAYLLLASAILLFAAIRIRLLQFPLERDEGEYAYGGQLILRGIVPYQLCYTMKFPGTALAQALIEAVFGQSPEGVHLGLLVVSSATIVLVFFLAKRLFGEIGAVVASTSFGLLAVSPAMLGFAAHASQFVILPAVGGTLLLLRAQESGKLALFFLSGVLFGLAVLMKQPGVLFVFFGIFWVAVGAGDAEAAFTAFRQQKWNWRVLAWRESALVAGAVLPFAITCLVVLRAGMFQKFCFWTFTYARAYGELIPLRRALLNLWRMASHVARGTFLFWGGSTLAGCLFVLFRNKKSRKQAPFVLSFLLFSFAAVCPGFHLRNHYFVLLLPALSLLGAGAVSAATDQFAASSWATWKPLPSIVFVMSLLTVLVWQRDFFFTGDPVHLCRIVYRANPFPEALQIAKFIRDHSQLGDKIAVIGSEPEIYFESNRLSATGYIYMYPLMEAERFASRMQREMIAEVEAAHPRYLVYVDNQSSWDSGPKSDPTIFQWFDGYVRRNCRLVAVVEENNKGGDYRWTDVEGYSPKGENRITIYEAERR